MSEDFTTKDRKKEFDRIFKEKILPFFESEGFKRHTKTSKRIWKSLSDDLSVFIFFEYKTFGAGFYDISIAYYDIDFGTVDDDVYLVMTKIKTPKISGENKEIMNTSIDEWIEKMKSNVLPFITAHSQHKDILNSDQFYFSKFREKERMDLLIKKAK